METESNKVEELLAKHEVDQKDLAQLRAVCPISLTATRPGVDYSTERASPHRNLMKPKKNLIKWWDLWTMKKFVIGKRDRIVKKLYKKKNDWSRSALRSY